MRRRQVMLSERPCMRPNVLGNGVSVLIVAFRFSDRWMTRHRMMLCPPFVKVSVLAKP